MEVQRPSVCQGFQSASSARSRSGGSAPQLSKVKVTQQVSQSRTAARRSSGESQPNSKSPPASNHGVGTNSRLFLGKAPSQKKDGYLPPSAVEARLRATKTLLSPVLSLSGTTTPTKEFHCENPRARSSPQSVPRSTGATTRTSSLKHRPAGRLLAAPKQKYPGRFTPVKAAMAKASQRVAPNQAASGNEAEHVDVTCDEPVEFVVESAMAEGRVSSPEARVGKDEHIMDEELRCSGAYHGQQSRGREEHEQCVTVSPENEHLTEATEGPLAEARGQHDLRDTEGEDDEGERLKQVNRVRPRIHTALHSQAQAAVVMMEGFSPSAAHEQDVGAWASVPLLKGHRHSTSDVAGIVQKDDCASRRARSASASMPSVHVEDEPEVRAVAQCHNTRSQALRGNAREECHLVEDPVADAAGALAAEDAEDDEKQKQIAAYRKRGRAHTALHSQAQLAVDSVFPVWEEPSCGGPWAQRQVPAVSEARHSMCDMSLERQEFVPRRLRAGTLPSSLGQDWDALSKMSAVAFKSSSARTSSPRRVANDSGPTTPRIEGLGFRDSILSTRTLSPRARTASSASSPCTSPCGLHVLEASSRTLPPSAEDWSALSKMSAVELKSSSTRTLTPRRVDNDSGPTTPRIEGVAFRDSMRSIRTLSPRAGIVSSASSPGTTPYGLYGLEMSCRTLPPSAEDSVACRLSRENSAETLASMVSIRTLTPLRRDVSTRTLSPRGGAMLESRDDSAFGRDVVCASALSSEVYDRKSLLMDRQSPSSRTSGVEIISLDPDAEQDVEQARAE